MGASFFFFLFSFVLLASGLLVITARNPVHGVLFLVLAFFNAAGLFILLGAEFVAMILVIVYVGAVAVLFLFVVMMLDVDFVSLRKGAVRVAPMGAVVGLVLFAEIMFLVLYATPERAKYDLLKHVPAPPSAVVESFTPEGTEGKSVSNTHAIGQVLYTDYILPFQVSGLILLVSMIGAIVLTHRVRTGVRRQNISDQVNRRVEDVLELRQISTHKGTGAQNETLP